MECIKLGVVIRLQYIHNGNHLHSHDGRPISDVDFQNEI
jgi:dolichyl-phosphate-mannose-protein mannosyltransferase